MKDYTMNATLQDYLEFCANKVQLDAGAGLRIDATDLHPSLFPHQRDAVQWALGRSGGLIAASFGMGKTRISIDLLRQVAKQTSKAMLVVCPLGVRSQFMHEDGPPLGISFEYVRTDSELLAAGQFCITNYERIRDGNISAAVIREHVGAVALDEGAILGNLGTKTQQEFTQIFADTPCWINTATPAPNDYRQLIYFADFLGVMDAGQALTRWFGRNPDKAGDLQLLPHMEREFWLWVASWALFIDKPSDLGYSDEGYVMPELVIVWHRIAADHEKAWELSDQNGQHYLFKDTAAGVQQAMKEKRDSLQERITETFAIVDGIADEQIVIWCDLNDEQTAVERGLKRRGIAYSSVRGSQSPDAQEEQLYKWLRRETRILISKTSMLGSGVNLQQCHIAIYAGVNFKFRDFIQSVHRLQRYGQVNRVELHIIHTDAEDAVVSTLLKKWQQHDAMVERMRAIVQEYGLTNEALASGMRRSLGVERKEHRGQFFTVVLNDCVLELMSMADNSVKMICSSIPFDEHYEYTTKLNDFGHNIRGVGFWKQMGFLISHLFRVLEPGRIAAIHVKDRLLYGHQTEHGMMEVNYFSHDCAREFSKYGFVNYGEIFIPTDVVRENNSTNRLGWTENCKDGSKMGVGLSEKVLLFRKPQTDKSRSYADEPVRKDKADYSRGRWQIDAHSLWRSNGHTLTPADNPDLLTGMDGGQVYNWYRDWSKEQPYDYHQHVAFNEAMGDRLPAKFMLMPPQAPPEYEDTVWTDILFMRTLNMQQAKRRVEKHLCPLALDVVERLIVRYSNEGDVILDPFSGLGTVPYMAVKLGRQGYGVELNDLYWRNSVKYCQDAEVERSKPTLFDVSEPQTNGYHANDHAELAAAD